MKKNNISRFTLPLLCGLALLLWCATSARAAIALKDGATNITFNGSGVTSFTQAFTISATGTPPTVMIVNLIDKNGSNVAPTSLSWNAQTLTKAVTTNDLSATVADNTIYYLYSPTTDGAAHNITGTFGQSSLYWIQAYTLTGTATSGAPLTGGIASATANSLSITNSGVTAGSWADICAIFGSSGTPSPQFTFTNTPAGSTTNIAGQNNSSLNSYMGWISSLSAGTDTFKGSTTATATKTSFVTAIFSPPVVLTNLLVTLPGQTYTNGANTGTISNQTAGTPFAVTLTAVSAGATITNITGSQTVSYAGPSNAPGGTAPSYTTNVTFTNGQCGGVLITLYNAQTTTITASITNLAGLATSNLTVVAASPSTLAFVTQPGNGTTVGNLIPQPVVALEDTYGNTNTSAQTVSLAIDNNPSSGTLSGTASMSASSGVAAFSGLSINNAGAGYTLTATGSTVDTSSNTIVSSAFNITGPASQLVFTTQPGGGTGGTAWAQQPVLTLEDSGGNTVTGTAQTVTVAISNNPSSGTLSGTTNVTLNTSTGQATFSGLSINTAGTGYTLSAEGSTVNTTPTTAAGSSAFNITVGAAAKLAYTSVPSAGTAGTPFSVTVQSQDAGGNPSAPTSTTTVTLSKNSGGGTLSGTLTGSIPNSSNSVTIATPVYSKSDTLTLTATPSGGFSSGSANSAGIPFAAGVATQLAFTTQPGGGQTGTNWAIEPAVTLEDANGNPVLGTAQTVSLSISNNPGSGTLSGTTNMAVATNIGVATFTDLSINAAGTGYTLSAVGSTVNTTSATAAGSSAFNIIQLTAYQGLILGDGATSLWPLNETNGTTMHDVISSNNGTVGGIGSVLGVHGVTFANNTNDVAFSNSPASWISIPYNAAFNTTNFSVEMWLITSPAESGGGAGEAPFGFSDGNAHGWTWANQGTTTLAFWNPCVTNSSWGSAVDSIVPIFTNQWVHYVATFDGSNARLYTNGVLASTFAQSGHILETSANTMFIGAYNTGGTGTTGTRIYPGNFENLAVYNNVLTLNQITNHYFYGTNFASAPVITSQPASQTNYITQTATFTVSAIGVAPLSYQWLVQSGGVYVNLSAGGQFSGVTNATMSISGLVATNATNYEVVVTNSIGSVTSAPATLTIAAATPSITTQPTGQSNNVGRSVTFTVVAAGLPPLSYQWAAGTTDSGGPYTNLSNGGQISGATNASLTVSNLVAGNALDYVVVVTNSSGSITSAPATLTVLPPSYTTIVEGDSPVSYWPLNETSGTVIHDLVGTNNGTAQNTNGLGLGGPGITFAQNTNDTAIYFTNTSSGYIFVPYSGTFNTPQFTAEVWFKMPTFPAAGAGVDMRPLSFDFANAPDGWTFEISNPNGANPPMQAWCATGSTWTILSSGTALQNQWAYYVETYNGTNVSIYTNGVLANTGASSYVQPAAGYPLYIGAYNTGGTGTGSPIDFYQGGMEKVAVYSSALTPSQITNHYYYGTNTTQLIVTLPGQMFTPGTGNTGTVSNQTNGVPFNITLTAVTGGNIVATTFTGSQTVSYSGPANAPGGATPTYTTTVTFTNGQVAGVPVTLVDAQTTTITGNITGLGGVPSSPLTVVAGPVSAANSTVSPATASITADGISTQVITVQARDAQNNNLTSGGSTVVISQSSGTGTIGSTTDNGTGTYTATVISPTAPGSGTFAATLGGTNVGTAVSASSSVVTYTVGPANAAFSTISPATASITANGTSTQVITVQARDVNSNNLTSGGLTVVISQSSGTGTIGGTIDNSNGTYTATVTSPTLVGSGTFTATLSGTNVGTAVSASSSVITYTAGAASAANSTVSPATASINAGGGTNTQVITVQARDVNNNNLTGGGLTVVISKSSGTGTIGSTTDNGNGTYTATVTSAATAGSGTFTATLGGTAVGTAVSASSSVVTYTGASPIAVVLIGTRAYDGTSNAPASILTISNNADGTNLTLSGNAILAGANIGSQNIIVFTNLTLGGSAASNYTLTGASGSVTVTSLAVVLTGTRPYDGTATATNSILTVSNAAGGDDVNAASGSATLAGSAAGAEAITDPSGLVLGGTTASNYTLTGASGSVAVTTVALSITANPQSKTYGMTLSLGTTAFSVGAGLVSPEAVTAVTLTASGGTTSNAPVSGSPYTITPSAATGTGGFLAANYNITYNTNGLTVNPLSVVLTGTRPYDGTATATNSILTVANAVDGDNVNAASGSATLAGANVGGESITSVGSLVLGGTTAGNYTLAGASGSVTITSVALSVTASVQSKTYGQTVTFGAGNTNFTSIGLQPGDTIGSVTLACSGGASNAPVGSYTITPSAATGGTFNPANYNTISYNTNTLTVNPRAVVLTGTQTYNGTTNVTSSALSVANPVGSDDVNVASGNTTMASADIGTNALTLPGTLVLGGTTASNYTLTGASGSVTITPLPVVLTGTRPYDGTATATNSILTVSNAAGGDDVNAASGSAILADSSAGAEAITDPSGLVLGGTTASNYTLTGASGSVAITTVALSITANPQSKTYGTTLSLGTTAFSVGAGLVSPEAVTAVTLTASGGTASNAPVSGSPYTITPSAATGTNGFLAANYNITYNTNSLTVNPLSVVLTGTRPYDGTATATNSILTVANAVGGDDVNAASGSATLASASVGSQAITSAGTLVLGGTTAGNYTLAGVSGTVTVTNPFNPFSITSSTLDMTGTNLVVCWQSVPGVVYNVLTNNNLGSPQVWVAAGSPITATDTNTCFTLPGGITGSTNAFVVIKQ